MLMDESNVEAGLNQSTFKLVNLGVVTRNIAVGLVNVQGKGRG